jgi:diguanylate cyclase (GGDEF)-like protein
METSAPDAKAAFRFRRRATDLESARPPRLVLRFAIYTGVLLTLAAGSILLYVRHTERGRAERAATREARLVADTLLADRLVEDDFMQTVEGTRRAGLDRLFEQRVLVDDAIAVQLVDPRGVITYATDHSRIGTLSPDMELVRKALGGVVVSTVTADEEEGGDVLRAYAAVRPSTVRQAGVFVLSRDYAPVAKAARGAVVPVVVVFELVLVALYILLLPILRRVTNRLRDQMEELEHLALHDALTGLANRTLFRRHVEAALAAGNREARGVAVLLLDLDRFKEINDTLGHGSGDLLLQELGRRMSELLGDRGAVARLGGDEFGVVSGEAIDDASALALADRLCRRIAEPFVLAGVSLEVQASVGIALSPEHGADVDTLMRHADVAMYAAKKAHLPHVYAPEENQYSSGRLALAGQLRRAIERNELRLQFQPQLDLATREVRTVEALVRWQHPERGLLRPDEFVPLAEHAGLIKPLTRWVIEESLAECRRWNDAGLSLAVAVNVSSRDIVDLNLPDEVGRMLARQGVDPASLELEITESTLLTDPVRATGIVERLSLLGVRLAIDDFGSGYSSLSHLRRLPVDVLKIDKSFVLNMARDESDETIVRSTIDLAHNLGLSVVAEGVENEANLRRLEELGCDSVQGYYLAEPLDAATITGWLVSRRRAGKHMAEVRDGLRSA